MLDRSLAPRRRRQVSPLSRPASNRSVSVFPDPEGPRMARRRARVVQATSSSKEPRRCRNWKVRPLSETGLGLGPEMGFDLLTLPVVAYDAPTAICARRGAGPTRMLLSAKTAIVANNAGISIGIIAGKPW